MDEQSAISIGRPPSFDNPNILAQVRLSEICRRVSLSLSLHPNLYTGTLRITPGQYLPSLCHHHSATIAPPHHAIRVHRQRP